MKNVLKYLSACAAIIAAAASCSTTRVLSEGEYRLVKNSVRTEGDSLFKTSLITPYIKQKTAGWNPMLYVYNWSGKEPKGIGKFFRAIGKAPVIYDADMVNTSASNMERQMEYLGYYNTSVKPEVTLKNKKASVTYHVKAGKRYKIRDIKFEMPENEEFRADFMKDTSNITITRGGYLSVASLEAETIRSAAYMRENGWYGFNKNLYTFEADTNGGHGTVALIMKIKQPEDATGKPVPLMKYSFGKVSVSRPASFPLRESIIKRINTIKPGRQYSESVINNTYSRFASLGIVSGVNITTDQAETPGLVDCAIDLSPARQRGFKVKMEASTSSNGLIGLSPELTYTNRNIFHGGEILNLSFSGDFQFKPGTDIRSKEFGVSAGIILPRFMLLPSKWFPGRLPSTQIKASYNYQDRPEYTRSIVSTSYTYLGNNKRLYYQISPINLNIVRLYNIDPAFLASLQSNPFLRNAYQNHLDIGEGVNLLYTTDPSIVPAGSYHYIRFQADLAGNILSAFKGMMKKNSDGAGLIWNTPFAQYIRGEVSFGKTWALGKGHSLASRILLGAGYAYGNSSALPFEKHFYSGGANSLRGWQARSVGPGYAQRDKSFVIPSQTGDMKFEANLEYRFPIVGIFSGALFVDAGNVWTFNKDRITVIGTDGEAQADTDAEINDIIPEEEDTGRFRLKDFPGCLAVDWGLGLRVNLSVILVRLDMGFKVHDPSRLAGDRWIPADRWLKKDGFALHLGVGLPF